MAPAASWASWADALHMIAGRLPEGANTVLDQLSGREHLVGCLGEVSAGADQLDRHVFVGRPSWVDLKDGARSPTARPSFTGAWGVATWLATSRVFRLRVPLLGDSDNCPVVCCRPGSRSVPRLSHHWSSSCNLKCFAHCCWRDCVSRCTS